MHSGRFPRKAKANAMGNVQTIMRGVRVRRGQLLAAITAQNDQTVTVTPLRGLDWQ